MEPAKKKSKKGFAVPSAKPTQDTNTDKEKAKPKKTLGINRNNNKVEEKTPEVKQDKAKTEETKTTKPENKKKEKPKVDETTTSSNDVIKEKTKVAKKDTEEVKKVARSLTAEEYDEIFMSVLKSVMKAEQQGDVDDKEEEEDQAPADDGEKKEEEEKEEEEEDQEKGEEEETRSEVIEVTVKVESVAGSEHFDHLEAEEDIDNWDGADKSHGTENVENNCDQVNTISPIRKEKADLSATHKPEKKLTSEKQKKEKKTSSEKEKTTENEASKPKTKKFVIPNETPKDTKVKKKRKLKETKPESKSAEKPVKSKDRVSLKKVMQERELEDLGTWVQCCNADCLKWRYLKTITDPMDIPQRWECSMNDNEKCNSCDKPEEDYDEAEHIYTKYTEGSVVLAKMAGYPWWPGMIEIDPDYETYFEVAVPASMYPTKYHVVFFDKSVSRAWISISAIKPFDEIEALPRKAKGHDYSKEVNAAIKNAKEAMELPIKERLKKFSFAIRFSGKWGHLGEQTKRKKHKKHKRRRPKKQRFDEGDVMVDDNTLDQILNNSQSVLSDVAEMLSSMESAEFDSDTDPEFDIAASKERKRKVPSSKVQSEKVSECPTLNAIAFEEEEKDEEDDVPVKFEVAELDKDIFTMEMDAGPMEESDLEKTVNDLQSKDEEEAESCEKSNLEKTESNKDEVEKKKKKKKPKNEDGGDKTEKKKPEKKKNKSSKSEGEKSNEDVTEKGGEEKVEKKKKKKQKKGDKVENHEDPVLEKKDEASKKKKTEKSKEPEAKKHQEGETENKEENTKESLETKSENKEQATQNLESNDSTGKKDETKNKPKKPKAKFSNPIAKTTDKDSQGKKSQKVESETKTSQKVEPPSKEDSVEETKKNKKSNTKSDKSKSKPKEQENDSDEELDLAVPSAPVDGADSDDDFMLDLNEPVQSKVQTTQPSQAAAVGDGEDSEPLDFEE